MINSGGAIGIRHNRMIWKEVFVRIGPVKVQRSALLAEDINGAEPDDWKNRKQFYEGCGRFLPQLFCIFIAQARIRISTIMPSWTAKITTPRAMLVTGHS